jgi:hypothetical protein
MNSKLLKLKGMKVITSTAVIRSGLNIVAIPNFTIEHYRPQISLLIQNKVKNKFR